MSRCTTGYRGPVIATSLSPSHITAAPDYCHRHVIVEIAGKRYCGTVFIAGQVIVGKYPEHKLPPRDELPLPELKIAPRDRAPEIEQQQFYPR